MAKKYPTAAELRLCVDRILPMDMKPAAARRAIEINPENDPLPVFRRTGLSGATAHPMKMALLAGKKWHSKGQTLGIRFLDGSKAQRARVQKFADEWTRFANIRFKWNGGSKSEIRISFEFDPDSWSAIGTDCLHTDYFKKSEPTMNFGWLTDDTDDDEYRRVVVHEFGHALGAIHEHQNPKGGIVWNEAAVYAAFSGPPNNWSKDEIFDNVIGKYSLDQLNGTTFDGLSIMLYPFPKELIKAPPSLAKKGTRTNWVMSARDRSFIKKMYPKS